MQTTKGFYKNHLKGCRAGRKVLKCECAAPILFDARLNGMRQRINTGTSDPDEAKRFIEPYRNGKGKLAARPDVAEATSQRDTLASLIEQHLTNKAKGERVRSGTLINHAVILRALPFKNLSDCTGAKEQNLLDYVQALKGRDGGPITNLGLTKVVVILRCFFRGLVEQGKLTKLPGLKRPPAPKQQGKARISTEDVARILAACTDSPLHYKETAAMRRTTSALIHLLLHSGLRISDAMLLKRSDFDGDFFIINALKNGKESIVSLPHALVTELFALAQDGPYLFWDGKPIARPRKASDYRTEAERALQNAVTGARMQIGYLLRDAGVKASPHHFRATFSMMNLETGTVSVADIANQIGDTVDTVTRYYANQSKDARMDAARRAREAREGARA